jgi:DNA-directed RNA polymerase specialized sigma24 family protein
MGAPMKTKPPRATEPVMLELYRVLLQSEQFRLWKPSFVHTTPAHIEQSDILKDERHFTPQELAELWSVSVQTIREIFQRSRRRYKTIRIPESVADRVHTRLSA